MCGIVGLLVKKESLRDSLGQYVSPMLVCMGERGPDSAGLAVFSEPATQTRRRFSLYCGEGPYDWQSLLKRFEQDANTKAEIRVSQSQAVLIAKVGADIFKTWLHQAFPKIHLLSVGRSIEMYKDTGHPQEIVDRYSLRQLKGTHSVGHTRMATESAVSPAHAHPFTAGEDFCLVHNGSLSNPYSIRRKLEKKGIQFETDNDTEAACRFLEWRMREGESLEDALRQAFIELDGFYTLLMATADKLVLVRDAFARKPAVVAETDDYVAISSEFRSLAHLPGVKQANLFEPAPEVIYSWNVSEPALATRTK